MGLQGQTVLVTGGARRIGRAIVCRMAEDGARVVAHYHRGAADAHRLVAELAAKGLDVVALKADLSDTSSVMALAKAAGNVRILINNASLFERDALRGDAESWERHMAINARAPFLLAGALVPGMRVSGGGVIVNMLDVLVERPIKGYAAYLASKAALWALTRQGAKEWGPQVRVNGVALGPMVPEEGMDEQLQARIAQRLPLGRWGHADEVARVVHFLVTQAPFATGAIWHLDGGMAVQ